MATGEWMMVDLPEYNIKKGDIMTFYNNEKYSNRRTKEKFDITLISRNSVRVSDFSYDEMKRGYRPVSPEIERIYNSLNQKK